MSTYTERLVKFFCGDEIPVVQKAIYGGSLYIRYTVFEFMPVYKAYAGTLDEKIRTIRYNDAGDNIILTLEQAKRGKRLFNAACFNCHVGGITKTNPNVGLDIASLGLAYPERDNVIGLVNFLISPKTFDGQTNISELHPCIEKANIWNVMRTLTEDDLVAISGHILLQAKVLGERWGGGKIYY